MYKGSRHAPRRRLNCVVRWGPFWHLISGPPWTPISHAIELLVRGPDGRSVSNTEIRILAIHPDDIGARGETGRTDAAGFVGFRRLCGVTRLKVVEGLRFLLLRHAHCSPSVRSTQGSRLLIGGN